MFKKIKVATCGVYQNYQNSLLPILVGNGGFCIEWVSPKDCDLLILGPFFRLEKKYRWLPKSIRSHVTLPLWGKRSPPLTLFHTAENVRYNNVAADFSITYDLGVNTSNHFRFPYWKEMLDWSAQGVVGNVNHRYGALLSIDTLMKPLGENCLSRSNKAAFFSSHLREPRMSIFKAVSRLIDVDGYGPYFDRAVIDHNKSGLYKRDILSDYRFNLCPENGCFPGYYTEKIPEAFAAGCIPITWTDSNVSVDFNPLAFINMFELISDDYLSLGDILHDSGYISKLVSEPLLLTFPEIQPMKEFLQNILEQATT
jgi:hypothetical protein